MEEKNIKNTLWDKEWGSIFENDKTLQKLMGTEKLLSILEMNWIRIVKISKKGS
jgi:hypothetical protein